jgi:ribose 5-phosphate isomerase A
MSALDSPKTHAALAAVRLIEDGTILGLGSGTTASIAIELIGERIQSEGLTLRGVPTSQATSTLARQSGISLIELDEVERIDLLIDGADEVDPSFRMIKGRGGALLREKLVASCAERRVYIVGHSKRVDVLGCTCPLPIEISPFGWRHTVERLRNLGASPSVRQSTSGERLVTDGGNLIVDCDFGRIDDPEELDARLKGTLGVFETGLFLDYCDTLIVGSEAGAEVIEKPSNH